MSHSIILAVSLKFLSVLTLLQSSSVFPFVSILNLPLVIENAVIGSTVVNDGINRTAFTLYRSDAA